MASNTYRVNSNLTGGLFDALEPGVNKTGTVITSAKAVHHFSDFETLDVPTYSFDQELNAGTYQFAVDLAQSTSLLTASSPPGNEARATIQMFNIDTRTVEATLVNAPDYTLPARFTGTDDGTKQQFVNFSGSFTLTKKGHYRLLFTVGNRGASGRNLDYFFDRVAILGAAAPTLGVSKSASPNPFTVGGAGQKYTITIGVANGPTTDAINISDALPTGVTVGDTITATGGTLSGCPGVSATNLNGCTIASGTSGPIVMTVPVNVASGFTRLTNTAFVSGGGDPNCTEAAPCPGSVTENNVPRLTVSKSVNASPLVVGSTTQSYTIRIAIENATTTAPILLSDVLPTGITTRSAITATGGTLSGCPAAGASSLAGCTIATGVPVGTVVITVPISVADTATQGDNTASVTGGGDPFCTPSTPCKGMVSVPIQPLLKVSKSVSATPLVIGAPGQFYTLTIDIMNGPTTAATTLADTLPTGITANGPSISATGGALSGCPSSATAANLTGCSIAAGTSGPVVVTVPITVGASASNGNNTASVSGGGDPGCPTAARCSGTVTVPVAPTLTPRKTTATGTSGTLNFEFVGDNGFGSQSITTTNVQSNVAGATINLAAASVVTTLTETEVSGFAVTAISCTGLGSGGTATNDLPNRKVTLNAAATVSGSDIVCTFTNTPSPMLNVAKTASRSSASLNETFSYAVTARNSGLANASTATSIRDIIPSGISITSLTAGSGWTCTGTPSSFPIVGAGTTSTMVNCTRSSAMAPGSTHDPVVTLNATKTASGSVNNTALVQNGGGDSGCASTTPAAGAPARCSATVTVTGSAAADLSVVKTATPSATHTGGFVTYSLTVNNAGPDAADNAVLRDLPSAELNCSDATLPALSCTASGGAVCPTAAALTRSALFSNAGVSIPTLPVTGSVVVSMQCQVTTVP